MRKVTLDLDKLDQSVLFKLAQYVTEKDVLEKLYEIAEKRDESWMFSYFAQNHCPENRGNIRKIALRRNSNQESYLSGNPLTPPEFLAEYLERNEFSDALYNQVHLDMH